jgi:Homeodomain-like domain
VSRHRKPSAGARVGGDQSQTRDYCRCPWRHDPGRSRNDLPGVQGWVSRLLARHRAEGEGALEARSRRPKSSPTAIPAEVVEQIVRLRKELAGSGLDAGPHTIAWHLQHHHGTKVGVATISRYLTARGLVTPEPKKKPKSALLSFAAEQPSERWQPRRRPSRRRHRARLLRPAGHGPPSGHRPDGTAVAEHGIPASTLTDNGMVFTTRRSGGRRGVGTRNGFETELRRLGVTQINSTPNHPTTCGNVERFQQTMNKWLPAQDPQPTTVAELQTLLDRFVALLDRRRPNPRPNPRHRHRPRPRPPRPRHRRRHRRTAPRPHPRPGKALQGTRRPPAPAPRNETPEPTTVGPGVSDVLRHHKRRAGGI